MRFRLTAFGLHLLGSFSALTLVLGGMYLGWYRWPGWYLSSVAHIVGIVVMVDLVLGPTLTLVVANANKPRRALTRDIGIIVTIQLTALVYGAVTLWLGRPLYYAFSTDCLQLVQASDFHRDEIAKGRKQNAGLAPYWYSLPRWVWAPLPKDSATAAKIVRSALSGGQDVIQMPRYFKPWTDGLPSLRDQLKAVDDIRYLSTPEKQTVKAQMTREGFTPDAANAIIFWGGSRRLIAVLDPATLQIKALLNPDSRS
jgi:hypothetical protein